MNKGSLKLLHVLLPFLFAFCKSPHQDLTYNSKDLELQPISKNSYIHISYLQLSNGNTFPCNGLVYVNDGSAAVFDSPPDPKIAKELIDWLSKTNNLKIVAFVPNHFHNDCIGGIEEFKENNIKTYAHSKTNDLIKEPDKLPEVSFDNELTIKVGKTNVVNRYFGEAHTSDNIISYVEDEELLFGGCMIKSIGAGKGNLEDANLEEWANTVLKIKTAYPNLKVVIPGHGAAGDASLLNFTIQLFSEVQ